MLGILQRVQELKVEGELSCIPTMLQSPHINLLRLDRGPRTLLWWRLSGQIYSFSVVRMYPFHMGNAALGLDKGQKGALQSSFEMLSVNCVCRDLFHSLIDSNLCPNPQTRQSILLFVFSSLPPDRSILGYLLLLWGPLHVSV